MRKIKIYVGLFCFCLFAIFCLAANDEEEIDSRIKYLEKTRKEESTLIDSLKEHLTNLVKEKQSLTLKLKEKKEKVNRLSSQLKDVLNQQALLQDKLAKLKEDNNALTQALKNKEKELKQEGIGTP
jgi:septal ring factor EnvC (AmiA/AmiB activator)